MAMFMLSPVKISSKSSDHDLLLAKSIPRCGIDIDSFAEEFRDKSPLEELGLPRPRIFISRFVAARANKSCVTSLDFSNFLPQETEKCDMILLAALD